MPGCRCLERVRSRRGRVIGAVTLLPLVTPEIVTGIVESARYFYSQL